MRQAPVFIVGMGRSGTTLLRLMLHHHPRLAIPYESGFLTDYYDRAESFGDLRDDGNCRRLIQSLLAEPRTRMWDHTFNPDRVFDAVEERSLPGVVEAIYSDYAAGKGKARWGDKSDYLDRLHIIHAMFPDVRFIHIIRDGRDVAMSVLKQPWGPDDIIRAAEWWNEHLWVARRVGAILGLRQYLEVRYEHLVENSERELRRCCEFLNEEYSADMLAYHRDSGESIPEGLRKQHYGYDKPPDASRVAAWKTEMNPYDHVLFCRHAHRMLRELDYEIPERSVSLPVLGFRYLTIMARRARSRAA